MGTFLIIWMGQLVSLLGTGLLNFALAVWIYEQTNSATQVGLILLITTLPTILIGPLAGLFTDRWDRRRIMMLSDMGAALVLLSLFMLLLTRQLELWHIYGLVVIGAAFSALQWPAYLATVTHLVPKQHFGRAAGLIELAPGVVQVVSPLLAGLLIATAKLGGMVLIDLCASLFALLTLFGVHIPPIVTETSNPEQRSSLLKETLQGANYLLERPGLSGLIAVSAATSFTAGAVVALFTPMLLSLASAQVLGTVSSLAGLSMLVGGLFMSIWGGLRQKIYSLLVGIGSMGVFITLAGVRPSTTLITIAACCAFFFIPICNGSLQAIWQVKVPSEMQGRVFALRRVVTASTTMLAYLTMGPLADRVFEPLLSLNGPLADSVGRFIGTGPGRGIGLLFVLLGLATSLVGLAGYLHPHTRLVEIELPDMVSPRAHDASARTTIPASQI